MQACHSRRGDRWGFPIHEKWKWRDLLLPLILKGETGERGGGINESCVGLVRRSNGDQVDQVSKASVALSSGENANKNKLARLHRCYVSSRPPFPDALRLANTFKSFHTRLIIFFFF